jgi:hypothetical protein
MTKTKKTSFQKALKVIADLVEGQLLKLPPEVADAKREKIRQIAASVGPRGRGKPLRPSRTRASRLSARSHA